MKRFFALLLCISMIFLFGCSPKAQPTTLTIWHVYGGQTDSPLNDLIDEFNQTLGKEQGITVQVTSVTNTNTIHKAVLSAANHDPGAAELPDIFVSYPKTVLAMPDREILVDYRDYFSPEELGAFLPAFIEEGTIDGRLVILPVAKSTEVLFINKTLFDRFSAATGAALEDLNTWESLFRTAILYREWSGKAFFVHDYHFNYFQVGTESLGTDFFDENGIAFSDTFRKVWKPYAEAALKGGVWLCGGYATEPLRTGEAIASVASSASVLYYADQVTYPDNTSEDIEFIVRPCPVFEGGDSLVMQRGAGLCLVKSTPEREKAAITFLKWLTEPERNVDLVTALGYMPVTSEGFETCLPQAIEGLGDAKYRELYRAFLDTQKNYTFYTAPQRDDYLELETDFEDQVRLILSAGAAEYEKGGAPDLLSEEALEKLESRFS